MGFVSRRHGSRKFCNNRFQYTGQNHIHIHLSHPGYHTSSSKHEGACVPVNTPSPPEHHVLLATLLAYVRPKAAFVRSSTRLRAASRRASASASAGSSGFFEAAAALAATPPPSSRLRCNGHSTQTHVQQQTQTRNHIQMQLRQCARGQRAVNLKVTGGPQNCTSHRESSGKRGEKGRKNANLQAQQTSLF